MKFLKTIQNNQTLSMIVVVLILAIVGFGLRSEGRLSALESKAEAIDLQINTIGKDITEINGKIGYIENRLTKVETDLIWIKSNMETQNNKIDQILQRLEK